MKKLIIGILLVVLGLPGTAYFFTDLVGLILGGLPVLLILGGGLAVYLGYEEIQAEKELDSDHAVPPAPEEPAQADAAPETQPPPAPQPPEKESATAPEFVGNTDTLVFHSISCNFSQGKKCTVQFTTRDDAVAQGYKPCKVCNP